MRWRHSPSQEFTSLGNTHFYGEYERNQDGFAHTAKLDGAAVLSSEVDHLGVGFVQEIDAASMSLWAKWRRHELDATLLPESSWQKMCTCFWQVRLSFPRPDTHWRSPAVDRKQRSIGIVFLSVDLC